MTKRILIADDEPDILKVITFRLTKLGYEIILAVNGQEAIEFAQRHKPDLILLDYRMPILDGLEACRKIKENEATKKIPIIFMTASSASIDMSNVKKVFGDDFIKKPFEAEDLLDKIKKFIS